MNLRVAIAAVLFLLSIGLAAGQPPMPGGSDDPGGSDGPPMPGDSTDSGSADRNSSADAPSAGGNGSAAEQGDGTEKSSVLGDIVFSFKRVFSLFG